MKKTFLFLLGVLASIVLASLAGEVTVPVAGSYVGSSTQGQLLYNNAGQVTGTAAVSYAVATGKLVLSPISGRALDINGLSGNYGEIIFGNVASGNSYGLNIAAGTTSADRAIRIQNQGATLDYFTVFGDGTTIAPASPLTAATTRVVTGLAAVKASDTTAVNNTLTADAALTVTFNETGKYQIEIFLPFYQAVAGTAGFQFDLNSGTATIGGIVLGVNGWSTAAVTFVGNTAISTATAAASIATAAASPSWFVARGWISVTVAGTSAIRWAQNTTDVNPTTLKTGAYYVATKIG